MRVAGVDGCPGGWVAVLVGGGEPPEWRVVPLADTAGLLALPAVAVGVDMPIGLPVPGEVRACDAEARQALGTRWACVFSAPSREVLAEEAYPAANALSRELADKGLSRQAHAIGPRIVAVDRVMTPAAQRRVVEVHPEVSFARMAGEVLPPKKTAAGLAAREAAVLAWRPDLAPLLAAVPRPARRDDALDACAAAWSAERWARGKAELLPPDPPRDARGLYTAIVV